MITILALFISVDYIQNVNFLELINIFLIAQL